MSVARILVAGWIVLAFIEGGLTYHEMTRAPVASTTPRESVMAFASPQSIDDIKLVRGITRGGRSELGGEDDVLTWQVALFQQGRCLGGGPCGEKVWVILNFPDGRPLCWCSGSGLPEDVSLFRSADDLSRPAVSRWIIGADIGVAVGGLVGLTVLVARRSRRGVDDAR